MEIHVSTLDQRALIVVVARWQQEHNVTGNHNLGGGAEKILEMTTQSKRLERI